jgi:hypothetical protein
MVEVPIDPYSNAIEETAKTAGKSIDLIQSFGSFWAKALGAPRSDVAGLAGGDYLRQVRIRN